MTFAARIPHGGEVVLPDASSTLVRLRTFHTLDALRGVAACAVVLYHAAFIFGMAQPAEGQIAVDLFFVMSGFIIAHRYDADLRRGMTLAHFAKLRLIRLYPLFLLGMVLGVVPAVIAVSAGIHDASHIGLVKSFPLAVFMLPSHFAWPQIEEIYPLNYVAWSLALEIVVNIAYAATHRWWTIRRIALLLAIAFAGLCVCAWAFDGLYGGFAWPHAPVGVVRVLYGFGAGAFLSRLFDRRAYAIRVPWWLLLVVVSAIFFLHVPVARPAWELFAIAVLMPMVVAAAATSEPPPALQAPCAIAGIYSYVLYSLHVPLVGFFLRGETRAHLDVRKQTPTDALLFVLLLAVSCVVAHHVYDKPVRRLLAARLMPRRGAQGKS